MANAKIANIPRLMIGLFAMAISLLLIFNADFKLLHLIAGFYLFIICFIDTLYSKIPNYCNLALLIAGFTYNIAFLGLAPGLWNSTTGFLAGLGLLMIPYLMGGIGGGDVKALAALGALLGPLEVLHVFLYVGLFGGVFAILHYLFYHNILQKIRNAGRALVVFAATRKFESVRPEMSEKLRFPYAAAFAFGFFTYVQWGDIFTVLKSL